MVTKIKKKKPITAPDEFIALPNKIIQYIQTNLKEVLITAIILVLIVSIVILGKAWWKKKKENSLFLYAQAQNLLMQGEKEKAEKILKQLANTHVAVAKFAKLTLASFYEEKQPEEALKLYEEYIKKAKKDPLVPIVYHALAVYYLNHKQWAKAEKILREMVEKWPQHFLAPWIYAHLGLLTEKKQPVEAMKMYHLALKYKDSPLLPVWVEAKIRGNINLK